MFLERCPSGLRSTLGKRVYGFRTAGSNPALSVDFTGGLPNLLTASTLRSSPPAVHRYCAQIVLVSLCFRPIVIQGGWTGAGNIDADPLLTPDGHLTAGSPCIDAGDGLPDWWELKYFGDPILVEPSDDPDGDLIPNRNEYLVYASNPLGTTLYISDLDGNDAWDGLSPTWEGSAVGPKQTIQAALDVAEDGDSILVAVGTYAGSGKFELNFHACSIVVRGCDGLDPPVIDCGGAGRAIDSDTLGTAFIVLERFVIPQLL